MRCKDDSIGKSQRQPRDLKTLANEMGVSVTTVGSVGLLNGIHHRLWGTAHALRAVPVTVTVAVAETALDRLQDINRGRNANAIILDHTEMQDKRVRFLL